MNVIPVKQERAWTFLENTPLAQLCNFSFFDFIFHVSRFMLSSEAKTAINNFLKIMGDDPDAKTNLYILAFVYRDTPFLQYQYSVYEKLLHSGPVSSLTGKDGHALERVTPQSEHLVISHLHNEAIILKEQILENTKKNNNEIERKKAKDAYCLKFLKIYELEQVKKVIIINKLEKLAGVTRKESPPKVNALKRKYYRWKNQYFDESINYKKWPTTAFLSFLALISLKYEKIGEEYFALKDVSISDLNVARIRKLGLNPPRTCSRKTGKLEKDYEIAKKIKGKDAEEKLKRLAEKNHLPAIKDYCEKISDKARGKYELQGAILSDNDFMEKRGWKAHGLIDLPLEVCNRHTKLRVQKNLLSSSNKPIALNSIVDSFSFTAKVQGEKWDDLYSKLRGKELSDSQIYIFPSTTASRAELNIQPRGSDLQPSSTLTSKYATSNENSNNPEIKRVTIKASPRNLDLLMKYADILPVFWEIHFSNNQIIYAQVWLKKDILHQLSPKNGESVEKAVPRNAQRQWTSREKLDIVLMGLKGYSCISELCSTYGITEETYNEWLNLLWTEGPKLFECVKEDHVQTADTHIDESQKQK